MTTMRLVITHVASGQKFVGDWVSDPAPVEEAISGMKETLDGLTYLTLPGASGTIFPGEFIRNHCILDIQTK